MQERRMRLFAIITVLVFEPMIGVTLQTENSGRSAIRHQFHGHARFVDAAVLFGAQLLQ